MEVIYKETKDFKSEDLFDLFDSVGWSSAQFPERLRISMRGSDSVISAWDKNRLIGLINCISDKCMTAYFHYLLVNPKYQGKGIGKKLLNKILTKYEHCKTKVLISYDEGVPFYKKNGFRMDNDKKAMFISPMKL